MMDTLAIDSSDARLHDRELKMAFARYWSARPDEYFMVIRHVFPLDADIMLAATAAELWKNDPEVIAEFNRQRDSKGEAAEVPSREVAALAAWEMRKEAKTISDKLNCIRTFTEIIGYTAKGGNAIVNMPVNVTANKVLMIKDKGDEKQWSETAIKQQSELVAVARAESIH